MSRACKWCSSTEHTQFYCPRKRNKPIRTKNPKPLKRTRLKKVGPVTRKWIATRAEWIRLHPGDWACFYCDCPLDESTMELDHKLSRSRHPELRFVLSNLVASCHSCNEAKGSLDAEEYLAMRDGKLL